MCVCVYIRACVCMSTCALHCMGNTAGTSTDGADPGFSLIAKLDHEESSQVSFGVNNVVLITEKRVKVS